MGGASDGEVCGGGVEEGFLDVVALKEVALSCREGEFISIARRHGKNPQKLYVGPSGERVEDVTHRGSADWQLDLSARGLRV